MSIFEPELTLRQLRGRLDLIHPNWLAYPTGVGIILGDFNICDSAEGPFNVWNQTFFFDKRNERERGTKQMKHVHKDLTLKSNEKI